MNGYELLIKEFNTLKTEFEGLKADVELLIKERDEAREAERKALERNAEMWAYYQAEEYKARQEGKPSPIGAAFAKAGNVFTKLAEKFSEDCRND